MGTPPKFLPANEPPVDSRTNRFTQSWIAFFQSLLNQASAAVPTGMAVTHAAPLTDHAVIVGDGADAVSALASLGTTTTVLHGNASGDPSFGAVSLTADVTGDLPLSNLAQGAALSVLGVTGNATADNASIAAGSDGQVLRRSGTSVAFGAVSLATAAAVTGVLPIANGGSLVQRATVTLTNAQIKALPTTRITIIAAPGAGFWTRVLGVDYASDTSAGAYTNLDATYCDLFVGYAGSADYAGGYVVDDAASTPALTLLTDVLGIAGQRLIAGIPYAEVFTVIGGAGYVVAPQNARSARENVALVVGSDNNGSGDYTGGNAANTLTVTVYFVVETL
jgi:hypothetical protein